MAVKRPVPEWLTPLVWFLASVFATGAIWYFLSREELLPAALSAVAAITLVVVAVQLQRLNDRSARFREHRENLGRFLDEAGSILNRYSGPGQRVPKEEHDNWVTRVQTYLSEQLDASYVARFNNFSGMTFFSGSGPEKNSVNGHCRRLHEFIKELGE